MPSDRLELLRPLITPKIEKLARDRLLFGNSLVPDKAAFKPAEKNAVKVALLLVQIMNPLEELTDSETAFVIGVSPRTFQERRATAALVEKNRAGFR